jgi:hypothetical protein
MNDHSANAAENEILINSILINSYKQYLKLIKSFNRIRP